MSDERSRALLVRAERVMPGGVNSPVRAFRAVGGSPVFIESARGSKIIGADGREYVDWVGSWGPAILGHAAPGVVQAVCEAAARGLSFGAPTELEVRFAERIIELYPSIEMLRCVSSGTEATMSALRVARGATGRDVIVKFDGGYHGHSDALLVRAGSGAATFGAPDSAGVTEATARSTVTLRYNDIPALERFFRERGGECAAVIVEPVAGNMGLVPPVPGFLKAILASCQAHGAISIFDEVMTGCRLARGGAQERFGLSPQITCLGKVVGGGMPLAVYGGRRAIMEKVSPLGPVYQAGTLSGNPLAVTAGLATLDALTVDVYAKLERTSAALERALNDAVIASGQAACVQRVGSMLTLFLHPGPVTNFDDARASDTSRFARLHQHMIASGVHWPASQFESAFVSAVHDDADIERTARAVREALAS